MYPYNSVDRYGELARLRTGAPQQPLPVPQAAAVNQMPYQAELLPSGVASDPLGRLAELRPQSGVNSFGDAMRGMLNPELGDFQGAVSHAQAYQQDPFAQARQQMAEGTRQFQRQMVAGSYGTIGGGQDMATQLAARGAFQAGQQGSANQALLQAQGDVTEEQQRMQMMQAQVQMELEQANAMAQYHRQLRAAEEARRGALLGGAFGILGGLGGLALSGGNPLGYLIGNQAGQSASSMWG